MIYYLVYSSRAMPVFSENSLQNILLQSRERNAAVGVTGILIYHGQKFLQVLEGERETVLALYDRISKDSRHSMILKNIEGYANERVFVDWSMAYKAVSAEEYKQTEGLLEVSQEALARHSEAGNNAPVLVLLKMFLK